MSGDSVVVDLLAAKAARYCLDNWDSLIEGARRDHTKTGKWHPRGTRRSKAYQRWQRRVIKAFYPDL